jgi:two-component system cell cycle sensor histidine kinase/response regulator CckA
MIRIQDTGTGIPEELREKVFEPFFTTKELGKGTGLGLASVKNILSRHGGYLTLTSQADKGTVFEVFLPSSNNPNASSTNADSPEIPRGNGELILVVDDEPQIREVSRRVLEMSGYEVETAGDGVEAIAVFARNQDSVKLLITDTDMPRMDGKAFIRVHSETTFLEKPYLPETLLKVAHEVLTAKSRNGGLA